MLHKETVSPLLLEVLKRLQAFPELKDFVLVGGTALSLQIGHRKSVDIDLFTAGEFPADILPLFLKVNGFNFRQQSRFKGGLFGHIENIKVDFIRHGYPWVKPWIEEEGIRMASLDDIAAMKLNAITGSGSRLKDYVDIGFLSSSMSLNEMLNRYQEKYPDVNAVMALKSLCYFEDIDFSPEIDYVGKELDWPIVQQRLLDMVKNPEKRFDGL